MILLKENYNRFQSVVGILAQAVLSVACTNVYCSIDT
jgi:hypothetical protein